MRRPLLVSDLDGTLLNSAKVITPRTAAALNDFIADGGLFSVATARTAYGCDQLLKDLRLRDPGVVMNGAALYSFADRAYLHVAALASAVVESVAEAVRIAGAGAFVFAVRDGVLRLGHARPEDLAWTQYNSRRASEALPPIALLGFENWLGLGEIVYLAIVGDDEQLAAVARATADVPGLKLHPYRNVYTDRDCLEVSSDQAGKEAAVQRIKAMVGADGLIVFGDNHNDVGMMRIADLAFAPANGLPEAIAEADEVIGSNDDDGVAVTVQRFASTWLPATAAASGQSSNLAGPKPLRMPSSGA